MDTTETVPERAGISKRSRGQGSLSSIVVTCGLLAAATYATYRLHGSPTTGVDDAQIVLNYSSNLAHGHGFVYNIGGPRVEGVTSLLWTLVAVVPIWLGINPELALLVLNVLLAGLVNSAVVIYLARGSSADTKKGTPTWFYVFLYLLFVIASPSYVTWATITLMDVGLWSSLVTAGALLILWLSRDRHRASLSLALGAVIVLLVLTRPESLLVCPFLVLLFCGRLAALGRPEQARGALIRLLGVFVLAATSVTIFRVWYFGYPFPNTYYAKVSPSLAYNLETGRAYLGQYLNGSAVVAAGALASVVLSALGFPALVRAVSLRRLPALAGSDPLPPHVASAMVVSLLLLLPVLTGGDHLGMFRFFQPGFPLLCLTLVLCLQQSQLHSLWPTAFSGRHSVGSFIQTSVLVLLTGGFVLKFAARDDNWFVLRARQSIRYEFGIAHDEMAKGEILQRTFAHGGRLPSLGVIAAGGIKRTYPGQVIDLMGLNEPKMGHSPGDRRGTKNHAAFSEQVFWQLQPDIVLPESSWPGAPENPVHITAWADEALRGIIRTPRFRDEYPYAVVTRPMPDGDLLVRGFFRRNFLLALEQQSGLRVKRLDIVLGALSTWRDQSNAGVRGQRGAGST